MNWFKKKEKKEVKSLGESVTWTEWDTCKLLSATKSHLITVVTKTGDVSTIVGKGLPDFDLILKEKTAYFVLHAAEHNQLLKNTNDVIQFMYCVSDDPSMETAGDWTQMGCMRVFFVLNGCTMEYEKDCLIVSCSIKHLIIEDSYNEISVDKVN